MRKNKLNHNRQFMFGIMAMAIVVLGVVVLFWMWCLPDGGLKGPAEPCCCTVNIDEAFLGDSLQVVWNDSVICDKVITESDSAVGFPVGSAGLLMISDVGSGVTASSNVSEEGGCFELYRDRGELFIKSVPDNKE